MYMHIHVCSVYVLWVRAGGLNPMSGGSGCVYNNRVFAQHKSIMSGCIYVHADHNYVLLAWVYVYMYMYGNVQRVQSSCGCYRYNIVRAIS